MSVPLVPTTDDGSLGHHGRVTEAVEAYLDAHTGPVALYACGPDPMLHAVARLAARRGLPAQVSLDPWMGCGVGTCLGCVVWMQSAASRGRTTAARARRAGVRRARSRVAGRETRGPLEAQPAAPSEAVTAVATTPRLAVEVGGLRLKNPLIAASGTFGYGVEYAEILTSPRSAASSPRASTSRRATAAPPRASWRRRPACSTRSACRAWACALRRERPARAARLRHGRARERLRRHRRRIRGGDAHRRPGGRRGGVEINISCPNVKKGGMAFGGDPRMTSEVVAAVRKATRLPVIPKLSPNVADIAVFAAPREEAGADAVSCINTLLGLVVDVETRRPRLAFGTGGLSGPAIRPIAVRMAWQAARAVKIPVIGIGGIASAQDALEFLIAGCRAVQIGTANFVDPGVYDRVRVRSRGLPAAARPRRHQSRGGHAALSGPARAEELGG
jgi:dihydroorotate dehydrogenase (NAD+) catalytic subunit